MRNRTTKLTVVITITLLGIIYPRLSHSSADMQRRSKPAAPSAPARYSKFSHNRAQHKLACNACHKFPSPNWKEVRKKTEAFPDVTEYPEHTSCVNCHRKQFFSGAQPVICSVCHENVSPRGGPRHPFPNPPEVFDASKEGRAAVSEFAISFPHDKHIDIVGQLGEDQGGVRFIPASFQKKGEPKKEESEPKSCSVCHQTYGPQGDSDEEFVTKPPKNLPEEAFWLKRGAFKTSPRDHTTCFTCHSEDSGLKPAPSDCGICHKLLPLERQINLTQAHDDFDPKMAEAMGISDKLALEKWSRRDTAKFRHEWLPHAGLSCANCHNASKIDTLDEKAKKVQVKSCGGEGTGCHIEATTEGILNLEVEKKTTEPTFQCTKCHISNGRKPAPETHTSVVRAARKK